MHLLSYLQVRAAMQESFYTMLLLLNFVELALWKRDNLQHFFVPPDTNETNKDIFCSHFVQKFRRTVILIYAIGRIFAYVYLAAVWSVAWSAFGTEFHVNTMKMVLFDFAIINLGFYFLKFTSDMLVYFFNRFISLKQNLRLVIINLS